MAILERSISEVFGLNPRDFHIFELKHKQITAISLHGTLLTPQLNFFDSMYKIGARHCRLRILLFPRKSSLLHAREQLSMNSVRGFCVALNRQKQVHAERVHAHEINDLTLLLSIHDRILGIFIFIFSATRVQEGLFKLKI